MKSIYIMVDSLPLKVVPEVKAAMDGHPILTYKYFLFRDIEATESVSDIIRLRNQQISEDNGNYFGFITFDQPGRMFTYTSNQSHELGTTAVEQVIEQITYYREHPELWKDY